MIGGHMNEIETQVLQTLKKSAEPMRPGDIAKAAGLDKDAVTKALNSLKKSQQVNSPKKCYYAAVK